MLLAQTPLMVTNTMDRGHTLHKASDKRRAQNRAAQKTYREKKKKRLEALETLAASAGLLDKQDVVPELQTSQSQSPLSPPQQIASSNGLEASDMPSLFDTSINYPSISQENLVVNPEQFDCNSITTAPQKTIDIAPRIWDVDDDSLGLSDNSLSPAEFMWPLPTPALPDSLLPSSEDSPTSASSCASPPQPIDQLQSLSTSLIHKPCDTLNLKGLPTVADPSINQIWFQTTSTWSAYVRVAAHLGLSATDPCATTIESPFYIPHLLGNGDDDALVSMVQRNFDHIKPDLRPTRTQILVKHAAYLDLLPFPELRDRVIELLAHDPPLLNEKEFCADFEAGGVVCWGSIAPDGTAVAGGGAPWDSRSWEAKTWFLNKWNWLIGEDSSLARSSEWWRLMHGRQQGISFF